MNLGGLYTFEQNIFLLENRNMSFEERIVEKDFQIVLIGLPEL